MALVALVGGVVYPPLWQESVAFTTDTTLDATADRATNHYTMPVAGVIDKVAVRVGAMSTAIALDVRLETVSATTGFATDTLWAANTSGSIAVPTANTTFEVTLTAGATVVVGDIIGLVVRPSGTPVNLGMARFAADTVGFSSRMPYAATNTTGAYALTSNVHMMGVHMSGGTWVQFPVPLMDSFSTANTFATTTSATTGTARGIRFRLPLAARLGGAYPNIGSAPLSDFSMVLYSDAGATLLTSQTFDKDVPAASTGARFLPFTGTYDLVANTWYRLACVPSGTAMGLREFSVLAADHLDTHVGGQDIHLCAFISSAWSDITTSRARISLWLTHVDDGIGGGYLLVSN